MSAGEWALPALGVNPNHVVSIGHSSGGYASSQLHFVMPEFIKGSGMTDAGPYMSGSRIFETITLPWDKSSDD